MMLFLLTSVKVEDHLVLFKSIMGQVAACEVPSNTDALGFLGYPVLTSWPGIGSNIVNPPGATCYH